MLRYLTTLLVLFSLVFQGCVPTALDPREAQAGRIGGPIWASVTFYAGTAVVHTNAPSTYLEFNSTTFRREAMYLYPFDECRVTVGGAANGASGSLASTRYSLDGGTVFATLATAPLDAITSTSFGTWQSIPAAAKTDVVVEFGLIGGDAAADPSIADYRIQCRHL